MMHLAVFYIQTWLKMEAEEQWWVLSKDLACPVPDWCMNHQGKRGILKMAGPYFFQETDTWCGPMPYLSILKCEYLRFIRNTRNDNYMRHVLGIFTTRKLDGSLIPSVSLLHTWNDL